jgi:hypothetical protein
VKLEDLQTQLFEWMVGTAPIQDTSALIKSGALPADERVAVYAEMYWLRMRDVLREEFPHVRSVLGDDAFDVLTAKYLKRHPSTHFSLNWLGQYLPGFLRETPVENAPFLADLAELEWARAQSFIAPDSAVAGTSDLAVITPETAASVRFSLTPSVRVIRCAFDVRELFQALSDHAPIEPVIPVRHQQAMVVFRKGFSVFHDVVSESEASALEVAKNGASLPELCEAFVAESEDDAAARAFQAIGSWVNEGLVASIEVPS